MPTQIFLSKEFLSGFEQSTETVMANLSMMTTVEMKKLAPYANPAQYPGGYPGSPGSLMQSINRRGGGLNREIYSTVAYAVIRNFVNNLNPQTKHYVERAINNVMRGQSSQWQRAEGWS